MKKASTLRIDRIRIDRHIAPYLGRMKINDITQADIERLMVDVGLGRIRGEATLEWFRRTSFARRYGLFPVHTQLSGCRGEVLQRCPGSFLSRLPTDDTVQFGRNSDWFTSK